MRTVIMGLLIVLGCVVSAWAIDGGYGRSSGDSDSLFVPTVRNSWQETQKDDWLSKPASYKQRITYRRSQTADAESDARERTTRGNDGRTRTTDVPVIWAALFITMGLAAVLFVPAVFLVRWIRENRVDAGRLPGRPRPTLLTATLIQSQFNLDADAESAPAETRKKTRRAA